MDTIEFSVEAREQTGKANANRARAAGSIPAILYGAEGTSCPLSVSEAALVKLLRGHGRHTMLLNLKFKAKDGEHAEPAIIKAIQRHPVNEKITHIDFLRVSLKKQVTVEVPVIVQGVAPGVTMGGVMQQAARAIQVRCLPTAIPESVIVDVSAMEKGDVVVARDLKLPAGVELAGDPTATILSIVALRLEEETPAPDAEAAVPGAVTGTAEPVQPEVIGEKERDERRLKKEEEKTVREAEKKEIQEARKKEEK